MTRIEIENFLTKNPHNLSGEELGKVTKCLPDNLDFIDEEYLPEYVSIILAIQEYSTIDELNVFEKEGRNLIYYDTELFKVVDDDLCYVGNGDHVTIPAKCTCCDYMFKGFKGVLDLSDFDTRNVDSFIGMFYGALLEEGSIIPDSLLNGKAKNCALLFKNTKVKCDLGPELTRLLNA